MTKYKDRNSVKSLKNYMMVDHMSDDLSHFYHIVIDDVYDIDEDDDEIIDWLVENSVGKWGEGSIGSYYFEFAEDAVACKLRWL